MSDMLTPDNLKTVLTVGSAAGGAVATMLASKNPVFQKIFGLLEGELDLLWGIRQEFRKKKAALRFQRALEMIEASGKADEVREVAPKLLEPWMQHASLEDDEYMQEMWSSLLANVALDSDAVRPVFVSILSEMSFGAAKVLQHLYEHEMLKRRPDIERSRFGYHTIPKETFENLFKSLKLDPATVGACLNELEAKRLVSVTYVMRNPRAFGSDSVLLDQGRPSSYYFSDLGWNFIEACQPPMKREPES